MYRSLLLSGLIFVLLISCDRNKLPLPFTGDIVYATSFESVDDLRGWQLVDERSLYNEAPAMGGKKSLYISGGCVVPHAYIDLPAADVDRRLLLECWGKNLDNGGVVDLGPLDGALFHLAIEIKNPEWDFYQAPTTLDNPAGTPLRLQLVSGGFVPGSMLVDMIRIRIVD